MKPAHREGPRHGVSRGMGRVVKPGHRDRGKRLERGFYLVLAGLMAWGVWGGR